MRRYRARGVTTRTATPLHVKRDRFSEVRFPVFLPPKRAPSTPICPLGLHWHENREVPSQFPNFHVPPQIKIGEKREETFSSALHPPPHPPAKKTTSKMKDNRSYSHTSQTRAKEATGQTYFFAFSPPESQTKRKARPLFLAWKKTAIFVARVWAQTCSLQ